MSSQEVITRTLSRPPSYIPRDSLVILNADRQQEQLDILHELGEYYHQQDQRNNYLNRLLFWNTDEEQTELKYKDACQSCLIGQFKGVLMAFWVTVFIFLGALSVFVPHLPKGAQALWIPLILYMIFAFFIFRHRHKESVRIDQLERQVLAERSRRRMNELVLINDEQHRQLPAGYFFEIQYDSKDHTHPYRTLLKPPPIYSN